MHFDDQAPPVAAWVVFLDVVDELDEPSTTVVSLEAQRRTAGRLGRHLTHVLAALRKLEAEGALRSSRLDPARPTITWRLTDEGRWFLITARRAVAIALRRNFRRRGGKHGREEKQRRRQRRRQR